jgi:adenylate cyclase
LVRIRFDAFEFEPRERRLLNRGQPCSIGSRALDVLTALVERRDRVVSKNELLELAWPGLVVEENNLSVQIAALRKILGAAAIVTITGRGYKFGLTCDADSGQPRIAPISQEARVSRRLVALVCADICHPSSIPLDTTAATSSAWRSLRESFIEHSLAAYAGEAIEITAERTMLIFTSAVDALAWSLDLQERVSHARSRDATQTLAARIAVIAAEVVFDQGKLVGDPFASSELMRNLISADEVCVSDMVRGLIGERIAVTFEELGAAVTRGVPGRRIWRVDRVTVAPQPLALSPRLHWNYLPTLAVLPFYGGEEHGDAYFGDGITEEIITALSLNRAFFVIARGSTLHFKRNSGEIERAAAELGVRYVITGSVRRLDQRLRIHVELTDAVANGVMWSERFDGDDEDLFRFQVEIASRISAAIDPMVHEAEIKRVRHKPTENFDAYDCLLRGLSLLFDIGPGDFEAAGGFFRRAIELDAAYAQAHAQLARWHSLRSGDGRTADTVADREAAEFYSQRAVTLDPRDALSLAIAGHIQSFLKKRFTVAMALFDEALNINPNCALAWARSGTTMAYLGRGEEALDRVRNAMRLSPFDQHAFYFDTTNGLASIVLGRYEEAVAWLSRAHRMNPRYRASARMLIAAHSLAGEAGEARELAKEFLSEEPTFKVSDFARWYPLKAPHLETVLNALRSAGMPD